MPPELEAKLIAPDELRLPDLSGLVKAATAVQLADRHLEATYYDTADFGLVRNGITLRYRRGEDGPQWTVKLPEASSLAALRRREISFDGAPGRAPPQAADLVRAYTRSRPLVRVARLHRAELQLPQRPVRPTRAQSPGRHLAWQATGRRP
jgi:hypothetical protein